MRGIGFYDSEFFTIKRDTDLYAENLKRLLMTGPGERVGQPYFGVGLYRVLFELADEETANTVKETIKEQVESYLPMLVVTRIESKAEDNSFFVNIGFIEKGDLHEDERLLTLEFDNDVNE